MKKMICISIAILAAGNSGNSQDRHFGRLYDTPTLPKGGFDIEIWNTYRAGRENLYNRLDQRAEFEVGLTDKLQTAIYLNGSHRTTAVVKPSVAGEDSVVSLTKSSSFSFSNEWKYNIADPSLNPFGFALYGEYTLAAHEIELEGKLLFDKRTEKNIFAANIVGEYEMEFEAEAGEVEMAKETVFENGLGYMFMVKPSLGFGIELRNHNEIVKGEWEHATLFAGPTLFFSNDKFFLILNLLPQLDDLTARSINLDEHEKFEVRLFVGFGL
ncbi:MAG: hypothetical protein HYY40_08230 [Bacteroidetes bacterium]|nr:hypothetical protein [Bacteroidota bacterium]